MAESYMEVFEETCYPPAFQKMAAHTIREFDSGQEKITEDIKNCLNQYMAGLIRLQEEKMAVPVAEVTFSFLYTSLGQEDAGFRIDSYGEGGRIYGASILTEHMPAPWLGGYLKEMEEELKRCVAENALGRYIFPAELEKLKLRAVRSLLYYFSGRFRYILADALDRRQLARVQKEPAFVIEMGEYGDWQKPVFALMPEVDVFNCDEDTILNFRRFAAISYKNKTFDNLAMNNCRYTDCTFEDSIIENCQMNDCIFDGCSFKNVTVRDTQMMGALFIRCDFRRSTFEKAAFLADASAAAEYYEPAEFYRCAMINLTVKNCPEFATLLKECDIENMNTVCPDASGDSTNGKTSR